MDNNLKHLKALLPKGRIIPVIGAGVSYSSTNRNPLTSWKGLLENGIDSIEKSHSEGFSEGWITVQKELLKDSSAEAFINVADNLVSMMGGQHDTRFGEWIKSTVGTFHVSDKTVLNAIGSLGPFVATTNYDTLLEEVVGGPPVTWKNYAEWQKVIMGDNYGVLHIHGCWTDPKTIVLDSNSYQEVTRDHFLQASLQSLLFTNSLMFVGFGSGLQDPNFSRLLDWLRKWSGNSPYGHFRLIRSTELGDIEKMHLQDHRILPVVYGDDYSDLPSFLSDLQDHKRQSKPNSTAKRTWRCLEEMTYIMMGNTPDLRAAFFNEIATSFFLSKGENQGGEVCMLYNLENRTANQRIVPVVKIYSNDSNFLSVLRERETRILTFGMQSKDPALSPERRIAMKQAFIREYYHVISKDWKISFRTDLGENFKTLKVRIVPENKMIEVETISATSINPSDYPHHIMTTSELFPFICSCLAMSSSMIDVDLLVEYPRLIPLIIDVLDRRTINLVNIRYDSDSPEEWLYINNLLLEETGDFLRPVDT